MVMLSLHAELAAPHTEQSFYTSGNNNSVENQIYQSTSKHKTQGCGEKRWEDASPISSAALVGKRNGRGNILHEVESWGLFEGTLTSTTPHNTQLVAADTMCSGNTRRKLHHPHPATRFQQPYIAPEEILNGKENDEDDATTRGLLFEGARSLTTSQKIQKTQFVGTDTTPSFGVVLSKTRHQQPTTAMQPVAADPDKILNENDRATKQLFHSNILLTSTDDNRGSPSLHTTTRVVGAAVSPMSSSSSLAQQDIQLLSSMTEGKGDSFPSSTTNPQKHGGGNSKGGGGLFATSQKLKQRRKTDNLLSFQGVEAKSNVKEDDVSTLVWLNVVNKCYSLSMEDNSVPIACHQPNGNDNLMNT